MKISRHHLASAVILAAYYLLIGYSRTLLDDTDILRCLDEFSQPETTLYSLREPLYWVPGKLLTEWTGQAWLAIVGFDLASFWLLYKSQPRLKSVPFLVLGLLLSPLLVLGLSNIHRQLVGFAVWAFLIERSRGRSISLRVALSLVPFFIHNSLLLLSFTYFLAEFIALRKWKLVLPAGAVVIALYLAVQSLGGDIQETYFREGTDTNTSVYLYIVWTITVFFAARVSIYSAPFMRWFALIGGTLAFALFEVSGGSSGSRFFMLVVTCIALWSTANPLFQARSMRAITFGACLVLALATPTFANSFSRNILFSALPEIQMPWVSNW